MFNFFKNAEISVDYDFSDLSIQSVFDNMPAKKYVFLSPYSFEEKLSSKYITNPYSQEENLITSAYAPISEEEERETDIIETGDNDETIEESEGYMEYEEEQETDYPIILRLDNFETELINSFEQTETVFNTDGSFITNLPGGEIYANKFEDSTIAPYYLEELSLGFEDINGFSIEYFDKTTNLTKKWLLTYNKMYNEYYLHGLNDDLEQIDSTHEGSQEDFKSMVNAVIQNCLGCEIKTATFYQ